MVGSTLQTAGASGTTRTIRGHNGREVRNRRKGGEEGIGGLFERIKACGDTQSVRTLILEAVDRFRRDDFQKLIQRFREIIMPVFQGRRSLRTSLWDIMSLSDPQPIPEAHRALLKGRVMRTVLAAYDAVVEWFQNRKGAFA
jgi:hypothetical protein